jgi:hypothetical protein
MKRISALWANYLAPTAILFLTIHVISCILLPIGLICGAGWSLYFQHEPLPAIIAIIVILASAILLKVFTKCKKGIK